METLKDRIHRSCRHEAYLAVRNPDYVLPQRSIELTAMRSQMIEEEKVLYDAELAAEMSNRIDAIQSRLQTRFGDDWMEWAKSLYIDDGSKLVSTARDWKEEVSWTYANELEKIMIIERLVNYKMRDRLRGFGSIEQDLGL